MKIEERNEIERMENEGGASSWWNQNARENDAIRELATEHSDCYHDPIINPAPRVIFRQPWVEPYLAWSYAGHGWVEVRSEALGYPPRRIVGLPDGSETLLANSLLQGEPPTGE